jgi:hypothetical protein
LGSIDPGGIHSASSSPAAGRARHDGPGQLAGLLLDHGGDLAHLLRVVGRFLQLGGEPAKELVPRLLQVAGLERIDGERQQARHRLGEPRHGGLLYLWAIKRPSVHTIS